MKKVIIRVVIVLIVCLVLAVVVSMFYLGSIVKKGVETVGPKITKTEVKLDVATLSFFSGSGSIKGLVIGNPEGFSTPSAIKIGSTKLGVQPGSVFSDKIHVTQVNIEAPEITFEGGLTGNNLNKLLQNVRGSASQAEKSGSDKSSSRKIQVDDLLISGGKINLQVNASMLGSKSTTVPLPEIHLTSLGQGANGVTTAELTEIILKEILQKAIPAAEKAIADLGKGATEAVKGMGKNATGSVEKATKSVTDIFKKK